MAKLVFTASELARIVEHSISSPAQSPSYGSSKAPTEPSVILVHDQGVYLMSNGSPRDIKQGEQSYVAYAKGCDPKDEYWHEMSEDLVGGDDFGETLPWAKAIKKMIDDGASQIVINFGASRMSLSAKYTKGKGPKVEPVKETPDQMVKRLQKMMKKKVIALNTKTSKLVVFATTPEASTIERIVKSRPEVKVLNGQPTLEVYKAVAIHQGGAQG